MKAIWLRPTAKVGHPAPRMTEPWPAGVQGTTRDRQETARSLGRLRTEVENLARRGLWEAAGSRLEEWLAQWPGSPELWLWLGDLRQYAGAPESAFAAWERAARPPGRLALAALLRIGGARLQIADASGARDAFRRALAQAPRSADAHCGLAAAAAQLGDFQGLKREAGAAVELDPGCYTAWYQLTLAPDISESQMTAMRRAAREANNGPEAWLLYMALGRVTERQGDYPAAFAAYTEGQRRRARVFSIDFARQNRYFASVRRFMDAGFVRRCPQRVTSDPRPIFIVGMPRSGTTLVEAILAAHPDVAGGGEMRFVYDWLRRKAGSAATETAVTWLVQASDETLAGLADQWSEVLRKAAGGLSRVTDKFPMNFTIIGLLALCFPDARIVHVRRDPRDTCVSCYTTALYGDAVPASLEDLGACYRGYQALMDHWRRVLGTDRIFEIEYEAIVRHPEPEIRKLLSAVELDWHPGCLSFHEYDRPVATASLYQVRQPVYSSSVGRWRHFESQLAPLFYALAGDRGP